MILGLGYMYRHRGIGTDYTQLNEYWQKRRERKWVDRYGFDMQRLSFLRRKHQTLTEEIDQAEIQRFD
jgi:hypothetical protein